MAGHDEQLLRPAVFHILLALAERERHGLGIADEVLSGGGPRLGPGTLYRSLKEMEEDGLIEETEPLAGEDPRRRFYGLTARGRELLGAEAERYARIVALARARKVLVEGERS